MATRPIIALIGRPNVGKSTLFNRLIGQPSAVTAREPGTTRDRHYGVMRWHGQSWTIIDTAGVLLDQKSADNDQLQSSMHEQVLFAIEEANLIALVVDIQVGIHPQDRQLINELRKAAKPLVVLANKADNGPLRTQAETFRALGAGELFPISGMHGRGISDFVEFLKVNWPYSDETPSDRLKKITFVGRPNVGKSTLLNRIIGEERAIVDAAPGTTRDTIEVETKLEDGTAFVLIDTAGIRRRGKQETGAEIFSVVRTLRAINQSDIVVLLMTIEEPPTRGDAHVAMYALEANKDLMIVLNKIDLATNPIDKMPADTQEALGEKFLKKFPFLAKRPFFFISAKDNLGVDKFLSALAKRVTSR